MTITFQGSDLGSASPCLTASAFSFRALRASSLQQRKTKNEGASQVSNTVLGAKALERFNPHDPAHSHATLAVNIFIRRCAPKSDDHANAVGMHQRAMPGMHSLLVRLQQAAAAS